MIRAATKSADDTRLLGAHVAALAEVGDVLLVSGDLGAGKTTFAQGFGHGLGVTEPVVSPTFTLVRSYPGRLTLIHCDAYRLDRLQEAEDLGLPELLEDGGVAVVEWGEVVAQAMAADYLAVRLELGPGDDDRLLTLRCVGPSWARRWAALEAATSRWSA